MKIVKGLIFGTLLVVAIVFGIKIYHQDWNAMPIEESKKILDGIKESAKEPAGTTKGDNKAPGTHEPVNSKASGPIDEEDKKLTVAVIQKGNKLAHKSIPLFDKVEEKMQDGHDNTYEAEKMNEIAAIYEKAVFLLEETE